MAMLELLSRLWELLIVDPFSRFADFISERRGLSIGVAAAVILIAGTLLWWLVIREVWIGQPVMLRIVEGTVEISTSQRGDFTEAADGTWLNEDTRVRAEENSLVVLQFFEGSTIKIDGPAEIHLFWCRSLKGEPQEASRSIRLAVLRGRVTAAATRATDSGSLFEVQTLNSVGVVQGTMFEVVVDEQENTTWEVSQNTVRVGAITVGNDLRAMVTLLPLNPGYLIKIPSLPPEWRQDQSILNQLMMTTRDMVRSSVKANSSDIELKEASMVTSNPEPDIAIFKVDRVAKPALTAAAVQEVPSGYKMVTHEILTKWVTGIVVAKASVVKRMFIP
ncbi:FecR domain-containing protein, partial [Chloroflexota bacterium]